MARSILAVVCSAVAASDEVFRVTQAVASLQARYWNASTGSWNGGDIDPNRGHIDDGMIAWWTAANAMEVLVQAAQEVPELRNEVAEKVLPLMFAQQNVSGILDSHSYDDSAWISLAWLRAYELTGRTPYLDRARQFFDMIVREAWDDTCGGGFYWAGDAEGGGLRYKNAITNELAMVVALRLREHAPDKAAAGELLAWAQRTWAWFNSSGMILSGELPRVSDGLADDCSRQSIEGYTYNQGVILAALGMLHEASQCPRERTQLIELADALAAATIDSGHYTVDGVLVETCEPDSCDESQAEFKGIFVRYLRQYLDAVGSATPHHEAFRAFLARNADAVWSQARRAPAVLGLQWSGPAPAEDLPEHGPVTQTSALGALLAALTQEALVV